MGLQTVSLDISINECDNVLCYEGKVRSSLDDPMQYSTVVELFWLVLFRGTCLHSRYWGPAFRPHGRSALECSQMLLICTCLLWSDASRMQYSHLSIVSEWSEHGEYKNLSTCFLNSRRRHEYPEGNESLTSVHEGNQIAVTGIKLAFFWDHTVWHICLNAYQLKYENTQLPW